MEAYIWDLDGTLIDSYPQIVDSLMRVVSDLNIKMNKEDIYNFILEKSVHELLEVLSNWYQIDKNKISECYSIHRLENQMDCELIQGAKKTLEKIRKKGGMNFIYTHKGEITIDILKKLGIFELFTEVVTSKNGFQRKPSKEAIDYILDKYSIDKSEACYIGDRPLDIECAQNAGIKGYLYLPKNSPIKPMAYATVIHELIEVTK